MQDLKVLVVIPARGGSKRLKRKNIYPVLGKPMLLWATEECKKSEYISRYVVSTEDEEIKKICIENNVEVVDRPRKLAADKAEKMDVVAHATAELLSIGYEPDIVVSLQPNSPEFKAVDLDKAISFFLEKLYHEHNVAEVISINPDMLQNACFRIMTTKTVFQTTLSTHVGVYMTDYHDIHTKEDVKMVEERINAS